jgi:hypothetical protein
VEAAITQAHVSRASGAGAGAGVGAGVWWRGERPRAVAAARADGAGGGGCRGHRHQCFRSGCAGGVHVGGGGGGDGVDVDVGVDADGDASGADGEEGEEAWGITNDAYFQPGLSFFSERGGMIDTFMKMGTLMARRDSKVM